MKNVLSIIVFLVYLIKANAQVGIMTDSPDETSILEVYSENKGVLIPRLTEIQKEAIVRPAEGLMIYNVDKKCLQINVGSLTDKKWTCLPGKPVIKVP